MDFANLEKDNKLDTDVEMEATATSSEDGSSFELHDVALPEQNYSAQKDTSSVNHANGLTKTLSQISRVRSDVPITPPPDGGFRAWSQVFGVHLSVTCYWGYIQAWGLWQVYYSLELLPRLPQSQISWIGSVQTTLIFLVGIFSGRLTDAGYFYVVFYAGAFFQVFGIFMTSLATEFWQILLAQGFCFGIGAGLAFTPQIALVSTYFDKKRVVAIALGASGSTTGGLIFPAIVRELLPQIGFGWTVRVIGFVCVFTNGIAIILLRWRLPPRRTGPWIDYTAFKEVPFVLAVVAAFFAFWSVYFGFFYIGVFARTEVALTYDQSINLLMVMIGVGLPSRVIFGLLADRIVGVINMLILSLVMGAIMIFAWIAVSGSSGLYAFAAIYGIPGGSIQSLTPALLASLTPDLTLRGTRLGMGFSVMSLAVLSGPPIAGALITADGERFLAAQSWAGASMILGSALLICARLSKTGLKLRAKA